VFIISQIYKVKFITAKSNKHVMVNFKRQLKNGRQVILLIKLYLTHYNISAFNHMNRNKLFKPY